MKRLTVNRLASAGINANRRAYRSLAAGIFLSVFLISMLCLGVQGIYLAQRELHAQSIGHQDFLLRNDPPSEEELRATGLFDRIGRIYITGCVKDEKIHLGYYDEEGAALLNRTLLEGRMPEGVGEIAVEPSVLEALRLETAVGETLMLNILPIDGVSEKRTFTLVGLLSEQSALHNDIGFWTSRGTVDMPAILTSSKETFATGRIVTHVAATRAPMVTISQIYDYCEQNLSDLCVSIMCNGMVLNYWEPSLEVGQVLSPVSTLMILLGAALILSTGVGISQAMEGQLARRTEEIGMLRAVGATRRQIRRIFGREAWMLALILAPLAITAACLSVWGLSRIAQEQFLFRPSPLLLAPVLILSVLCILLSANLPLRRASRIMPMGVLKDTALLRKSRSFRSREIFRPQRLIAWRQYRLHPTRPLGAAALIGLTMVCLILLIAGAWELAHGHRPDYGDVLLSPNYLYSNYSFADNLPLRALTKQDFAQIRGLDGVENLEVVWNQYVNLVVDEVPEIFTRESAWNHLSREHLMDKDTFHQRILDLDAAENPSYWDAAWNDANIEHSAARDAFGVSREKILIPYMVNVVTADIEAFSAYVEEGSIDRAAIDAGREVIAYLPDLYWVWTDAEEGQVTVNYSSAYGRKVKSVFKNDGLTLGQKLTMIQACASPEEDGHFTDDFDAYLSEYSQMEYRELQTRVGAVLRGGELDLSTFSSEPCIITTARGAAAMGLQAETLYEARIDLQEGLEPAAEQQIVARIKSIASRGVDIHVNNRIESLRKEKRYSQQLLMVLGGVIALFTAVSIAMITGNITRRIRADERAIGTLRAVGADERMLLGCYQAQVVIAVVLGLLIGGLILLLLAALLGSDAVGFLIYFPAEVYAGLALAVAAFAVLCLLACQAILRARIREVVRRPVVENIREL